MKIYERGVLDDSEVYFHTPSGPAKSVFLHIRCVGRYNCNENYQVIRNNYESYLLLYVVQGSGYVWLDGVKTQINAGTLVLLDCFHPHQYGTEMGWSILWAHFSGPQADGYYDLIHRTRSLVITPPIPSSSTRALEKIFRMFHHEHLVSEALINRHLVCALTDFMTTVPQRNGMQDQRHDFEDVFSYVAQNLESPINLNDLARRAALSPYHFCRIFKQETGYTPHQYIINARVNAAKFLLKTTTLSNKEILVRCGFNNESGFCTVFKRLTGQTPRGYKLKG